MGYKNEISLHLLAKRFSASTKRKPKKKPHRTELSILFTMNRVKSLPSLAIFHIRTLQSMMFLSIGDPQAHAKDSLCGIPNTIFIQGRIT